MSWRRDRSWSGESSRHSEYLVTEDVARAQRVRLAKRLSLVMFVGGAAAFISGWVVNGLLGIVIGLFSYGLFLLILGPTIAAVGAVRSKRRPSKTGLPPHA